MEKFGRTGDDVKGVLVCDKSGLALTSESPLSLLVFILHSFVSEGKGVTNTSGPIARLAELAGSLSGRRPTVCLEHNQK